MDESTGSVERTRWKLENPGVKGAAVGAMVAALDLESFVDEARY